MLHTILRQAELGGRKVSTIAGLHVKKSPIHGRGLFAKEQIHKGSWIGTYRGPTARRNGAYVLWCPTKGDQMEGISGKNILRFVNHSRRPNAEFYGPELFALRTIRPGEEITFNYGEDWDEDD